MIKITNQSIQDDIDRPAEMKLICWICLSELYIYEYSSEARAAAATSTLKDRIRKMPHITDRCVLAIVDITLTFHWIEIGWLDAFKCGHETQLSEWLWGKESNAREQPKWMRCHYITYYYFSFTSTENLFLLLFLVLFVFFFPFFSFYPILHIYKFISSFYLTFFMSPVPHLKHLSVLLPSSCSCFSYLHCIDSILYSRNEMLHAMLQSWFS